MNTLRRRVAGVTLIELAFVIGIIAIIVVAALAIFNTVRASQDRSTALQNISSIRSAIATWAGDRPLGMNTDAGLRDAGQLRPWLPGRLGTSAQSGLSLNAANPWNGAYTIEQAPPGEQGAADAGGAHPYRYVLVITEVPSAEAQALCRQLEEGAALDSGGNRVINLGSRGTGGCTVGSSGDEQETGETQDIYVEYRV